MKFPFFASFIIFGLVLHHAINRNNKIQNKNEESFWERENAANNVRKQSLDSLNYISFSTENFLLEQLIGKENADKVSTNNPRVLEIIEDMYHLENVKKVNLSYMTNTDLKFAYGVANLQTLSEYDQNYSELITLLQEYAVLLKEAGFAKESLPILEYAISIGTDISTTYQMCASIYQEQHTPEKILELILSAEKILSSRKDAIIRMLKELECV